MINQFWTDRLMEKKSLSAKNKERFATAEAHLSKEGMPQVHPYLDTVTRQRLWQVLSVLKANREEEPTVH